MKKYKDFFNLENTVRILPEFSVVIGGYYFNKEHYLKYNLEKKNGRKNYNDLLNKYYFPYFKDYKHLNNLFDNVNIRLVYQDNKLSIIFDHVTFVCNILNSLKYVRSDEKASFIQGATYSPEKFTASLNYFLNLELERYKKQIGGNTNLITMTGVKNDKKSLVSFYEQHINNLKIMIRKVLPAFEQFIDFSEFTKCFEYDKLCLLAARSIIEEEKGAYLYQKKLCSIMHIVTHSVNCYKKYMLENNSYNESIRIDSKGTKYSVKDLINEYNNLVKLDDTYSEDYFEDILVDEAFPWEILSSGNKLLPENSEEQNISQKENTLNCKKDEDTYEARKIRVVEGFNYLKNANPIKLFKGIGKFEGYIGFEYKNGIVIFEKAYESDGSIAVGNATYIMNRNNFKRLSQFTKSQIMFILRQSKIGIQRLYHTENMKSWKSSIDSLINNSDYTPSDYSYIDELIALKQLEKSKIKK